MSPDNTGPEGTGPIRAGAAVPGRAAVSPDGTGPVRAGAAVPAPPGAGLDLVDGPGQSAVDGQPATAGPSSDGRNDGRSEASAAAEKEGLRHKIRTQRRLRVGVLSTLAALVLLVLPAVFGIRSMTSDPVFASLDALNVPSWAAQKAEDQGYGSRWCFLDCRFRERIAESEKSFPETTEAYTSALTAAGWKQWKVADCPETAINTDEGSYSCWRRDELTLDLYVSLPGCAVEQVTPAEGTGEDAAPEKCDGSTVSIKVQNTITDLRGKTETNPGLVGETPDPVLPTDDPLLEPTPEAS
ncbi:hypothetical protein AB0F72_07390 [Actinoplanes sp. NPDC023936]|uniref:hypothetical protein n=1 Tax=Actinoplanes sp. NPDC023936 TaxID=3154910 RepID=UPI0033C11770